MSFEKDTLERAKFADLLISLSAGLATVTVLPAGRVITVDAPWGSGKSWIAKQLPEHFEKDKRIGKCIYIDAFEFDYHQDPFAVVTSAILDSYKTETVAVKNLKDTAVSILKVTLPAVGKEIVKAGINYAGIDDKFVESINKAGEAASEKAIAKMLDTFTKTIETTRTFKKKLEALVKTNAAQAPLVVVIDELDRCRPSFALEMLERVKHLFDIQNVVFIFFAHTPALHSAIRKTYGNDINPSEYLRKFIALTVALPVAENAMHTSLDLEGYFKKFLNSQYPQPNPMSQHEHDFREAVTVFASIFQATFRDIENVMLIWHIFNLKNNNRSLMVAYLLFIRTKEPYQFKLLKNKEISAYELELQRLREPSDYESGYIGYMRDLFIYCLDPNIFEKSNSSTFKKITVHNSAREIEGDLQGMNRTFSILSLEYLRL